MIELIIAVFIFSILIVVAGGTLVSALSLQRRALNEKKVEENGRFILELMTREIRIANPVVTGNSGSPPDFPFLTFDHPVNGRIIYSLSGGQVHREANGADSVISNPDVEVTRLAFGIIGNDINDDRQPRVAIILRLRAGGSSQEAAILDLQTTVSQRVLSD